MDVFALFTTTSYTFLQLASKSGGNAIVSETEATGIFKLRSGMVQSDNVESFGGTQEAQATLHIRPTEPFIAALNAELVGHGIRVTKDGHTAEYRITGQVEGFDYDTDTLEFYRVTLKRESLWEESDLPLV